MPLFLFCFIKYAYTFKTMLLIFKYTVKKNYIKNSVMSWCDLKKMLINYIAIIFVLFFKYTCRFKTILLIFKYSIKYNTLLLILYYVWRYTYFNNLNYFLGHAIQKSKKCLLCGTSKLNEFMQHLSKFCL